jgi:tetratricopeptide (TPR) repeat protein
MSINDPPSVPDSDLPPEGKLKKLFKSGPLGIILAIISIISLILWGAGLLSAFSDFLYRLLGVFIPEGCVFIFIVVVSIFIAAIEQLRRKIKGRLDAGLTPAIPRKSFRRKILWIAVISAWPIGVFCETFAWRHYYEPPRSDADVTIFIDHFDVPGWKDIDITKRLDMKIRREFNKILPDGTFKIMPYPPKGIDSHEKKKKWICGGGATLLVYCKGGDESHILPDIEICSDNVPPNKFEELDLQTGILNIAVSSEDSTRLCYIEHPSVMDHEKILDACRRKINYLCLLSLGKIFLYDDLPALSKKEELEKAYQLFSRALAGEKDRHDCSLDYCEALYSKGTTALLLGWMSQETESDYILLDSALILFERATDLLPDFYEAWFHWGTALDIKARRRGEVNPAICFRDSFDKFSRAVQIKPDFHDAFFNWGMALNHYALRFEGKEADNLFKQSFEKFAAAVQLKPDFHEAFYNWALAARDYYQKVSGGKVDSSMIAEVDDLLKAIEQDSRAPILCSNMARIIDIVAEVDPDVKKYADMLRSTAEKLENNEKHSAR